MSALLIMSPQLASARSMIQHEVAIVRLLDKITARVEERELPLNQTYRFGGLSVEVRTCQQTPPEEPPEATAFLVANVLQPGTTEEILAFRGWMFASNPALSALEHPIYDVWLIACKNAITAVSNASETPAVAPSPSVPAYVPPANTAPSEGTSAIAPADTNAAR
jgi:hypothetical protein